MYIYVYFYIYIYIHIMFCMGRIQGQRVVQGLGVGLCWVCVCAEGCAGLLGGVVLCCAGVVRGLCGDKPSIDNAFHTLWYICILYREASIIWTTMRCKFIEASAAPCD